jgi:predicted NBD/HSP70 family sugar kinase
MQRRAEDERPRRDLLGWGAHAILSRCRTKAVATRAGTQVDEKRMRKIDTENFQRATRTTPRRINRSIVLNLVRVHQPISRADLARRMGVSRGMVTSLVDELLAERTIFEGETADSPRGRRPTQLYVRTRDRYVVAVDVRFTRTYLMLADFAGREISLETFDTRFDPDELVEEVARRIRRLRIEHRAIRCEGIGMVVPGMVDRRSGRVLNAPQLGWRDVDLLEPLQQATGLRVHVENAPIACALAQVWLDSGNGDGGDNFVYVTVSDGVGAGVVMHGQVVRGHSDTAGEFGHISLDPAGPMCVCGLRGCWEVYSSNVATLARYLGIEVSQVESRERLRAAGVTVPDLVERARKGDQAAAAALSESAHYLGIGLAGIINALNPARIVIGGEITMGWDLIEPRVRAAARSRTLTPAAAATPITTEDARIHPRLRGATALVVAPIFAAPEIA